MLYPLSFFKIDTERFRYPLFLACIFRSRIALSIIFFFVDRVDDGFPPVIFHFENSLLLKVYPHEYLFQYVSMLDLRFCVPILEYDAKMGVLKFQCLTIPLWLPLSIA